MEDKNETILERMARLEAHYERGSLARLTGERSSLRRAQGAA
jgi:hypothetical protein